MTGGVLGAGDRVVGIADGFLPPQERREEVLGVEWAGLALSAAVPGKADGSLPPQGRRERGFAPVAVAEGMSLRGSGFPPLSLLRRPSSVARGRLCAGMTGEKEADRERKYLNYNATRPGSIPERGVV